jgi:hypothetical protein
MEHNSHAKPRHQMENETDVKKYTSPGLLKIACLDIYRKVHKKPLNPHKRQPDEENHGD